MVEDEQDIAGLIKHTLERGGDAAVSIVHTGDAALKAVADQQPDLMILDLNLPVLSGTEVCRLVRSKPATAKRKASRITPEPFPLVVGLPGAAPRSGGAGRKARARRRSS